MIQWPGGPSVQQFFPFPDSMMYYITKSPSNTKGYNKMIQSCKYFYEKNPILVVRHMDGNSICFNEKKCTKECCLRVSISRIIRKKLWLVKDVIINPIRPTFISSALCPKIYRCDIKKLGIKKTQISFNDFQLLSASAENVILSSVPMIYEDGSTVMLESILGAIPNVVKFFCCETDFLTVNSSTTKNIVNLPNLSRLKKLTIFWAPKFFDVNDIITFANGRRDVMIKLYYKKRQISLEHEDQIVSAAIEAYDNFNFQILLENQTFRGPDFSNRF